MQDKIVVMQMSSED